MERPQGRSQIPALLAGFLAFMSLSQEDRRKERTNLKSEKRGGMFGSGRKRKGGGRGGIGMLRNLHTSRIPDGYYGQTVDAKFATASFKSHRF